MVIRLTTGTQIGGALRYNEQKVVQKQAYVLGAAGFANDELAAKSRSYATSVLESQSKKNPNVKKPTLHFSLSLHPTEQVSDAKFNAMAHQFMAEMGYKDQPYVVYRHYDTAHPHIHIVTTCVDDTGNKIKDAFIKRRTNAVRQKLELRFGLIQAQGRGKQTKANQLDEVQQTSSKAAELAKRDQLEAILRQTFQQSSFQSLQEFKELLKKQHVRATFHQSNTGGKTLRGVSYQFTDDRGRATTPRIKASELGAWATWKGIEKQLGEFGHTRPPQQGPQDRLSFDQYKVLAALLSDQLREYKKSERIYYESQLIENFPTVAMQAALHRVTQNKLSVEEVTEAVRRFEEYKRAQLRDIIKKEQLAFVRTMDTYVKIGSEIEGTALNKLQYFSALSVALDKEGLLTSPTNRHLTYQIDAHRWSIIWSETGPDLRIPNLYSRGERTVLLLSDAKKPFKESYYDVRVEHLEGILKPDRMALVHQQLNENYLTRLTKEAPVVGADQVRYFYQRGLAVHLPNGLVEGTSENSTAARVRYNKAPDQVAVAPGSSFAKQIPHINLQEWQRGLTTEAGRYMVALAQCIDQAKADTDKSNEIESMRKRIHQRDPALATLSNSDLLTILEKRSQQGRGWILQTENEGKQEPRTYIAESAGSAELLNIRAADVFGYEQTGKYKNVGKGVKRRGKGQGREL